MDPAYVHYHLCWSLSHATTFDLSPQAGLLLIILEGGLHIELASLVIRTTSFLTASWWYTRSRTCLLPQKLLLFYSPPHLIIHRQHKQHSGPRGLAGFCGGTLWHHLTRSRLHRTASCLRRFLLSRRTGKAALEMLLIELSVLTRDLFLFTIIWLSVRARYLFLRLLLQMG
jgi:hypothetical protein